MKRVLVRGLAVVVLIAACDAAAKPETEAARDEAKLALWPLTTSSDEARQQVTDGVRELDMNRDEEAYGHFERAVATDPNAAMAHFWAATAAQSLESFFAHLAKASELVASAGEVERTIIQTARKSADSDDEGALAFAKQLVTLDANNPRSWVMLGNMHDNLADREQARVAWTKATEVAPNFAPPYFSLSASYAVIEPRDLAKAEATARKGVELEPNEPFAHDILGDALRAQGKLDAAAAAYTKAAELDPTKGAPLQQRGHVNTFLGRYAEARADYDAAVALATGNTKPTLAMYRALAHVYEGNPQAALDELEQLSNSIDGMNVQDPVGLKSFVTGPQFNIAVHYGMVAEAARYAARLNELGERQIEQAKTPEFARNARAGMILRAGYLELTKGNYAGARAKAAEYMKLREPDKNPAKNRPAHDLLGLVALRQKQYADAVREFEQGSPNNIYINYQDALALEGAGRTADAQKLFDKVANFYFNNEGVAIVRKDALAKSQKPAT